MNRYDPDHTPDAPPWLALDEQDRLDLAEEHHRRARIKLPNRKLHAIMHVIVENQLAQELEPVVRAMARLVAEDLSRHEAMHAVASVLAKHLHDPMNAAMDPSLTQAAYCAALERLDARSWRRG